MRLLQVATNTVSSAVSSVTLTGIDSDDVYMVALNNVSPSSDNKDLYMKYQKASDSSTDSTSNYDYVNKGLYASGSFQNNANTNLTHHIIGFARGNATNESSSCIIYLYNTFSSSEYSFQTTEAVGLNYSEQTYGEQGGGVHTVNQSNSGVVFTWEGGGNFTSGTFTLYKVV